MFKASNQLIRIIAGAVLGIVIGTLAPEWGLRLEFLGILFLNALKMMVIPIVATSLIVGVTHLKDSKQLGSMGIRTLIYYFCTTGLAVIVGTVLVVLIQPGAGGNMFNGVLPEKILSKEAYSIFDVLMGMIHPNLFEAAVEFKILPIIVASMFFGIALMSLGERAHGVSNAISVLNDAVMKIVDGIMFFAPLGICGLIAHRLGITGGGIAVWQLIVSLGKYCFTVVAGLGIHAFITLPLIYFVVCRKNPFVYFLKISKALATAFATASSSATLPLTMECVTKEAKVSNKTASVVLPLGATINMDGTALYEAVAAVFIAQSYGIELSLASLSIIVLTATLASVGAAGIPEAGLVTLIMVLQAIGLPVEGIGLILAVDWILDRVRTTVNVWGDSVGAAVVDSKISNETEVGVG